MKCLLTITLVKDNAKTPDIGRYMVTLDQSLICLSGEDRPIDIVIASLASIRFPPKEIRDITRPIKALSEAGMSNIRAAIPAGAMQVIRLDSYFNPIMDHRIDIHPDPEWIGDVWLSIDGEEPCRLDARLFTLANECEGNSDQQLFQDTHNSDRETLRQDQLISGAVLTGLYTALFETSPRVPINTLTRPHAILGGILAAMSGHSFISHKIKSSVEWAVGACSHQFNNFQRDGYLLSDRIWNPQFQIPGPRLAEAQAEADPEVQKKHYACSGRKLPDSTRHWPAVWPMN